MGLPDQLVTLLREHEEAQQHERGAAHDLWTESGYVFTTPTGAPLNPRNDWAEWKRLVGRAGVPDRRLHDARHTAATVLLLLGVTERTVMGVMGWSSTAMAAKYQHVIDAVKRDVATQVDGLLWEAPSRKGKKTRKKGSKKKRQRGTNDEASAA
jgi:integrase